MKRKLLCLVLGLTMVSSALLTGCGDTKGEQNQEVNKVDTDPSENSAEEAQGPEGSAEGTQEPVTIRVASWRSEDEAYYQEMVSRFQEQYDWINVELDLNADESSYTQNLQADIAEGKAPDVFDLHTNDDYVTYAGEGVMIPQDDLSYMANYSDGAKAITSVDGKNYGFMNSYNIYGMVYNKGIFEEAGVDVPKDFDDFVAICKKLREDGYGGVAYPGQDVTYAWLTNALFCINMGADGFKDMIEGMDSGKHTDITQLPGLEDALRTEQAYRDNNIFYDASEATSVDQSISLFAQGMAPMLYHGSWIFGTADTSFPGIDAGFFPIPTLSNNGKSYAEGGQVSCIYAKGQTEAASLWIDFIASPEISGYYCTSAKTISSINGVALDFEGGDMLAAAAANGVEVLPVYVRNHKDYWNDAWKKVMNELFVGGTQDYDTVITEYVQFLTELDLANLAE